MPDSPPTLDGLVGHAGTLDPFATGLLLLLSGRTTKLAPVLVGLDKRYLTDFAGLGESAAEWIVSRQVKTFGG